MDDRAAQSDAWRYPPSDSYEAPHFGWLAAGELIGVPVPTRALELEALLRHLEIDGEFNDWPNARTHLAQARVVWERLGPPLAIRLEKRGHLTDAAGRRPGTWAVSSSPWGRRLRGAPGRTWRGWLGGRSTSWRLSSGHWSSATERLPTCQIPVGSRAFQAMGDTHPMTASRDDLPRSPKGPGITRLRGSLVAIAFGLFALAIACIACKKPPPPPVVEEAGTVAPADSTPQVLELAPLVEDSGPAQPEGGARKWTGGGGGGSNANQAKIRACCAALRSQAKTLGAAPEAAQLNVAAGTCDILATQVGASGSAPEFNQLRAVLQSVKLPAACAF